MWLLLLSGLASAGPGSYAVSLMGGVNGLVGPPSVGGGVSGRAAIHASDHWSLEAGIRESLASRDPRSVGGIEVTAVYSGAAGWRVRGGFFHHHETPWDVARDAPIASALGVEPGIRHRSGVGLGVGWVATLPDRTLKDRLGVYADVSAAVFPEGYASPFYAVAEVGMVVGVGRRRPGATSP